MSIKNNWICDVPLDDKIKSEDIIYVKDCVYELKLKYNALKTEEKILLDTLIKNEQIKESKVLYYSYVDVLTIVGKTTNDSYSIEKIKNILDMYRIQLFEISNLDEKEKYFLFNKLCCYIITIYKNKYNILSQEEILNLINNEIKNLLMKISFEKTKEKNKNLVLNKKNKLFA